MANTTSTSRELAESAGRILRESNTLLEGQHFVYISGDHGSGWVNKDVLLPDTKKVSQLSALLAQSIVSLNAEVICGPAIGGLVMSQWVAHHLGLPSVFTEHGPAAALGELRPKFVLKRGFEKLVKGRRVLIVDDIVNTGHSIRQTAAAVRDCGGEVIAAAAYCSRGNTSEEGMDVPEFVFLVEFKIPSWPGDTCRLCAEGVPINTDYAHGRDYLEALKNKSAKEL